MCLRPAHSNPSTKTLKQDSYKSEASLGWH